MMIINHACMQYYRIILLPKFVFYHLSQNPEEIQAPDAAPPGTSYPACLLVCSLSLRLHFKQCHQPLHHALFSVLFLLCTRSSLLWSGSGGHVPCPWRYDTGWYHNTLSLLTCTCHALALLIIIGYLLHICYRFNTSSHFNKGIIDTVGGNNSHDWAVGLLELHYQFCKISLPPTSRLLCHMVLRLITAKYTPL